jgi:DNA-binding NarL/FixJ family response regulator
MAHAVGESVPAGTRRFTVQLIEAQALFVPTLADLFGEVGLELTAVSSGVDVREVLDQSPDVVFLDADFLDQEPLRLINVLGTLLPNAAICMYSSRSGVDWRQACRVAGATAVFGKNAARAEIVSGLRDALAGLDALGRSP